MYQVIDKQGRTADGCRCVSVLAVHGCSSRSVVLAFDEVGLAEVRFAGHRLIVAHDPLRAEEQAARRCASIVELEAMSSGVGCATTPHRTPLAW